MSSKNSDINKKYWEKNIEGFAGFYETQSEESIAAPGWFAAAYKKLIFPLEKKYMADRYKFVCEYIDKNVKKGMKVADIGCGSGVYSKRMIERGAFVYALDYAESAVSLTKRNLSAAGKNSYEVHLFDISHQDIPSVDLAISVGVLTYIDQSEAYFDHILPFTKLFLFNYLDENHILNALRRNLSLLDVRNYSYHQLSAIEKKLHENSFKIKEKQKLATGFIICTEK